jgi:hypoxanthine phosphoribosyltransferase
MKKIYHTWQDVERQTQEILRQINLDRWRPDYVVGLTRGGLVPANLISQYLECRMETLKVSLRDSSEQESNLWMAEDAFEHR